MEETIIAISTPIGESAIGMIRLSGSKAIEITDVLFSAKTPLVGQRANTLCYGRLVHPETREILDDCVVSVFKAPRSYTGEDMTEISCHGNPIILKEVLELFHAYGARLAQAGEFTLRAYLNGKMDLAKAEAVNDIIRAHTRYSLSSAKNQLYGRFSLQIEGIHRQILDSLALFEAAIDHSDLDEEFYQPETAKESLSLIITDIERLLSTARCGKICRNGLTIALIGAPNTGKSSLLNLLLSEERVIVSDIAGTTRDVIAEELNIRGITVRLLDTAGLRQSDDFLEKRGMEMSRKAILESDLRICLLDASREINDNDRMILELIKDRENIYLLNKCDLSIEPSVIRFLEGLGENFVRVSVKEKTGMSEIEDAIADFFFKLGHNPENEVLVTNARHENCLSEARANLIHSLESLLQNRGDEIVASFLRKARNSIEEITGKTDDDAILDRIFGKFCIGK